MFLLSISTPRSHNPSDHFVIPCTICSVLLMFSLFTFLLDVRLTVHIPLLSLCQYSFCTQCNNASLAILQGWAWVYLFYSGSGRVCSTEVSDHREVTNLTFYLEVSVSEHQMVRHRIRLPSADVRHIEDQRFTACYRRFDYLHYFQGTSIQR